MLTGTLATHRAERALGVLTRLTQLGERDEYVVTFFLARDYEREHLEVLAANGERGAERGERALLNARDVRMQHLHRNASASGALFQLECLRR